MLDWIKNISKEYPDFWKLYLNKFETKSKRFVCINFDKTGLNPKKDVILSIGCIGIHDEIIRVGDNFEVMLFQYKFLHDNGMSNSFLIESKFTKLAEPQAIQSFIDFIGNSILVGHRIYQDIELLNEALEKLGCGKIKNEAIDIEIMYQKLLETPNKNYSFKDLISAFKLQEKENSSVSDNAISIALLFLKLKSKLGFK